MALGPTGGAAAPTLSVPSDLQPASSTSSSTMALSPAGGAATLTLSIPSSLQSSLTSTTLSMMTESQAGEAATPTLPSSHNPTGISMEQTISTFSQLSSAGSSTALSLTGQAAMPTLSRSISSSSTALSLTGQAAMPTLSRSISLSTTALSLTDEAASPTLPSLSPPQSTTTLSSAESAAVPSFTSNTPSPLSAGTASALAGQISSSLSLSGNPPPSASSDSLASTDVASESQANSASAAGSSPAVIISGASTAVPKFPLSQVTEPLSADLGSGVTVLIPPFGQSGTLNGGQVPTVTVNLPASGAFGSASITLNGAPTSNGNAGGGSAFPLSLDNTQTAPVIPLASSQAAVLGSSTLEAGGAPIITGGHTISVDSSGGIYVDGQSAPESIGSSGVLYAQGSPIAIATIAPGAPLSLDNSLTAPITPLASTQAIVVGSSTLTPGGPAITTGGHTVSVDNNGGIHVDGQSASESIGQSGVLYAQGSPLATATIAPGVPASGGVLLSLENSLTAPITPLASSQAVVVGSSTLAPGGPAITTGGHTVSVDSSGGIHVDGQSASEYIGSSGIIYAQGTPVATAAVTLGSTIGDTIVASAAPNGAVVFGSITLSPSGSATIIDGHTVSIGSSGAVAIDGQTVTSVALSTTVGSGANAATAAISLPGGAASGTNGAPQKSRSAINSTLKVSATGNDVASATGLRTSQAVSFPESSSSLAVVVVMAIISVLSLWTLV